MKKIKKTIDKLCEVPLLSIIGAITLIVIASLSTVWFGMKTALAIEPYVTEYEIIGSEDYLIEEGDTLLGIAEKHISFFPETRGNNEVDAYSRFIELYNGLERHDIKWGETIKLPIFAESSVALGLTEG